MPVLPYGPGKSTGGLGDMVLASAQTVTGAKTFNAGTLLDKGSLVFSVKAYGAIGNNTTDDTAAIQSAVDAANTAGGGIVLFPAGTYKISTSPIKLYSGVTPTIVAYSNITLQGSGARGVNGTIINQTTTGIDVFKGLNDPANGAQSSGINFKDICVAFSGTATNSGNGIYLAQQATSAPAFIQFTFSNVRANGFQGTGKAGFNFESLIVSSLDTCHAYQCATGFLFNGSALAHYGSVSTSVTLRNCYANAPALYGFRVINGTYVSLLACAVDILSVVTGNAYSIEGCNSVSLYSCGFELDGVNTLTNGFYIGADASSVGSLGTCLYSCYGFKSKSTREIYITGVSKGVRIDSYQSNSSVSASTSLVMDAGTSVMESMCNFDVGTAVIRTINATAIDTIIGDGDGYGITSIPTLLNVGGVQVPTISSTVVLTNKSISGATNTVTALPLSALSATGTPSSTTYLRGDNTWAAVAGGGSGITRNISTVTTTVTVAATAATDYVVFIGAGGVITLPTAVGNTNQYTLKTIDTVSKTVATTLSQTIDGSTTAVITPNTTIVIVSDTANWRIV